MRNMFAVKGMHCEGCASRSETAREQFPEITAMEVDHRHDLVAIEHQGIDLEAVTAAITRLGFTITRSSGA